MGGAAKGAKFAFISADGGTWAVSGMCSALGFARRGCCAWRRRPPSPHDERDLEPARLISEICESSRRIYGAPKARVELLTRGVRASRKRVARIMRDNGWPGTARGCAMRPEGAVKSAMPQASAAPDLVGRDFSADGPDRARFAGITYVRTHRGRLCPAPVMDIWPRRIVGRSMSDRMGAEPADGAVRMAVARRRPPAGCTRHSDHGSQCVSLRLGRAMRENGIGPSTGSASSPWDNAAMESLMGLVKAERVSAGTFDSRDLAALEVFECIECSCNRVRTRSALGYLSPEEFEARNREGAAVAA
ncbi:MAG: IS3 family transposase [Coriobacteriaceae bacterium]|nr:IS3 family transposase [Coriobacteriaceae bacterium]